MRLRFHTALMWLLLLALPLQGFAAATMISCGPNHHRMLTAAPAEGSHSHRHAAVAHRHAETGLAAHHHEVAVADKAEDAFALHHLDKVTKFKCSACAACCMGAAMPTAAVIFEPVPPALTLGAEPPSGHVSFFTDGPDRPPRHPLV